ncbi:unnamed protein product, partial [Ectocarpus sp. 12 AP-2014]
RNSSTQRRSGEASLWLRTSHRSTAILLPSSVVHTTSVTSQSSRWRYLNTQLNTEHTLSRAKFGWSNINNTENETAARHKRERRFLAFDPIAISAQCLFSSRKEARHGVMYTSRDAKQIQMKANHPGQLKTQKGT